MKGYLLNAYLVAHGVHCVGKHSVTINRAAIGSKSHHVGTRRGRGMEAHVGTVACIAQRVDISHGGTPCST